MPFISSDKFAPLKLVKRAIGIFVWTKHRIDPRHQFAVVALQDTAMWVLDFTSNPADITNLLDGVNSVFQCSDTFDMSSLFDIV